VWTHFKYEASGYCDKNCVSSLGEESAEMFCHAHLEDNDAEHTDLLQMLGG